MHVRAARARIRRGPRALVRVSSLRGCGMNPLAVEGVGMHPFGRFEDKPAVVMGAEAIVEALTDAELRWRDIDLLVCAHMYAKTGAGHRIAALLGQTGVPILNV